MSDSLDVAIGWIKANWPAGVVKPAIIEKMEDYKLVEGGINDVILLYQVSNERKPFGIGAREYQLRERISCDMRTTTNRARAIEIRDALTECFRKEILVNKTWVNVISIMDDSNELRKLWRFILDIEFVHWERYNP